MAYPCDSQVQTWLQTQGLTSYQQLAHSAGVGLAVITRLRRGQADQIPPAKLQALALALGQSPLEVLNHCSPLTWGNPGLEMEYRRLENRLSHQSQQLTQQFREQTFQQLESLLSQYPTAHYLAQQAPTWPAKNVTSLLIPLGQLLQRWEITAIGTVGAQVAFDPQIHQAPEAIATGELVYVRFVGYRTPEKLLTKAKVSRTPPPVPG